MGPMVIALSGSTVHGFVSESCRSTKLMPPSGARSHKLTDFVFRHRGGDFHPVRGAARE